MALAPRKIAQQLRSGTGLGGNGGQTGRCGGRGATVCVGDQGFQARSQVSGALIAEEGVSQSNELGLRSCVQKVDQLPSFWRRGT